MSNVEKLKKRAAEFEAKRQIDKAIQTYLDLFRAWEHADHTKVDVALFNRVGDLLLRAGNVGDAMTVWEKAVDHYAEGGFHNNAIALCNKILRHSPGRTSVYYKLGKMSAHKGFRGDARKNYLEYAERMQKSGNVDEAFRALKEFADLSPDDGDIRQVLADQLLRAGKRDEAIEQLQVLYERHESIGEADEAARVAARIREIDPAVELRRAGPSAARQTSGLVFLDLDAPSPPPPRKSAAARPGQATRKPAAPPPPPPKRASDKPALDGLPFIDTDDEPPPRKSAVATSGAPAVAADELLPTDGAPFEDPAGAGAPSDEPPIVSAIPEENAGASALAEEFDAEEVAADEMPELLAADDVSAGASLVEEIVVANEAEFDSGSMLDVVGSELDEATMQTTTPEQDDVVLEASGGWLVELDQPGERVGEEVSGEVESVAREGSDGPPPPPVVERFATPASGTPAADVPLVDDITFGASFGTEELEDVPTGLTPTDNLAIAELDPTGFGDSELPVSASLATPEDVTFGSGLTDAFDLSLSAEPADIEFDPNLDVGGVLDADPAGGDVEEPTAELAGVEGYDAGGVSGTAADAAPELTDSGEYAAAVDDVVERDTHTPAPRRTMRPTMSVLAQSVELLHSRVLADDTNWQLRREYGEALLEDGDRDGGLHELETALSGFEQDGDLDTARSVAEEIIRLKPRSLRHHQKRVEFAFRMDDRTNLVEAYIDLAQLLFLEGQSDKARVVYERVLELAPDDDRALSALAGFVDEPAPAAAPRRSVRQTRTLRRSGTARPSRAAVQTPLDVEVPAEQPRDELEANAADVDEAVDEAMNATLRDPDADTRRHSDAFVGGDGGWLSAGDTRDTDRSAPETAGDESAASLVDPAASADGDIAADVSAGSIDATHAALDSETDSAFEERFTQEAGVETPTEAVASAPGDLDADAGLAREPEADDTPRAAPRRRTVADPDGGFVDLEDWLKEEDEQPKSTRMVIEERQTGDEDADFRDMLRKFKQGVARNVDDEDHESHYDLGVAYKEMGLVDEAIAEFQKALRGPQHRARSYEALGQCFVEKGQPQVALTILQRAIAEPGAADDKLVGVLYLLGVSAEALGRPADAVMYYQRVFAVDINFRDVRSRMRAIEQAGR